MVETDPERERPTGGLAGAGRKHKVRARAYFMFVARCILFV